VAYAVFQIFSVFVSYEARAIQVIRYWGGFGWHHIVLEVFLGARRIDPAGSGDREAERARCEESEEGFSVAGNWPWSSE
jgi:hypothetical protein